jgi:hypothetical protein
VVKFERIYAQRSPVETECNTLESNVPQHNRPAVYDTPIAQQYSSTTFVTLRFLSRSKKLGPRFKKSLFQFFTFLNNCVSLKLP